MDIEGLDAGEKIGDNRGCAGCELKVECGKDIDERDAPREAQDLGCNKRPRVESAERALHHGARNVRGRTPCCVVAVPGCARQAGFRVDIEKRSEPRVATGNGIQVQASAEIQQHAVVRRKQRRGLRSVATRKRGKVMGHAARPSPVRPYT